MNQLDPLISSRLVSSLKKDIFKQIKINESRIINETSNRDNRQYQKKHQKTIQQQKSKVFKIMLIAGLIVGILIFVYILIENKTQKLSNGVYTSMSDQKYHSFPTKNQQYTINNLIKPLVLNSFNIKFHYQNPQTKKQQLNKILSQFGQFILLARSQNKNKRYVFGVYGNQNQPRESFIFSLNKKSKHILTKPSYLMQIDRNNLKGPSFGKLDLSLFNSNYNHNSKTTFCYSFQCPPGIEYNTQQANTYLAGNQEFHIDEIVIFAIDQ